MNEIIQALMVAFEFCGQKMSDEVIAEMAKDLAARYRLDGVVHAIKRCRSELTRITYADIVQRIPGSHPGAEEAWAIVSPKVRSDDPTVFVTDPMREAYGAALEAAGDRLDMVAARMAFKEVYTNAVGRAGDAPVAWSIIPGTNRAMKELAITEAVKKGLVGIEWAMKQLPVDAHQSLVQFAGNLNLQRIA